MHEFPLVYCGDTLQESVQTKRPCQQTFSRAGLPMMLTSDPNQQTTPASHQQNQPVSKSQEEGYPAQAEQC